MQPNPDGRINKNPTAEFLRPDGQIRNTENIYLVVHNVLIEKGKKFTIHSGFIYGALIYVPKISIRTGSS